MSNHTQPPKKRSRLLDYLLGVLKRPESSVPYCVAMSVNSGFSYPDGFAVADYDGLLGCHVVKTEGSDQLVSYWSDKAHYEAAADSLKMKLSIQQLEFAGLVAEISRPREKLWKRIPVGSYILFVAAIFGALSAIQDYFGVLFEPPIVDISYASPGQYDVVEGSQISVQLATVSEVRLAKSEVKIDSSILRPDGAAGEDLRLDSNPKFLPSLGPGQSQIITIYGTAPRLPSASKPAVYSLSVAASTRAGIFRLPGHPTIPNRTVWVWSLKPSTYLRLAAKNPSKGCQFDGAIYKPGQAPPGTLVKLEVVIYDPTGTNSPKMIVSPPPGVEHVVNNENQGIAKAQFTSPTATGFQTSEYQVYLEFQSETTSEMCKSWLKNVNATADWTTVDIER